MGAEHCIASTCRARVFIGVIFGAWQYLSVPGRGDSRRHVLVYRGFTYTAGLMHTGLTSPFGSDECLLHYYHWHPRSCVCSDEEWVA